MNITLPAAAMLAAVLASGTQAAPLRDPFARPAPPVRAEAAAVEELREAPPRLRAVMLAPDRSLANINGQILAVGEWFGDYRVVRIRERDVTLEKRGAKSVLELDEASRK